MSKLLKSKFLLGVMVVAIMAVAGVVNTAAASECSTGTTTLRVGSTGAAVVCLQTSLDSGIVADGKFGPLTKARVVAWQASKGLVADGVFGPKSRAVLVASEEGTTSTVAGCTAGALFSSTTGASCTATTSTVAGCTAGALFSSTTGASCTTGTVASSTGEGSVTVTYNPTPASNLVINKGETRDVMGIKVKATGSDMKVNRLWLDVNSRIWLSASEMSLKDGSTVLATVPLSADTVLETTTGSVWEVQFNGFNLTVPVGTTKILTVSVTRPVLTQASAAATVQTSSTLRATDMAGFSNTYALGTFIINLSGSSTSTTGVLTASLNTNSPAAQSVTGLSTTAGTLTDVKLMDFDLKATDGPINVSAISGTDSSTGTPEEDMASLELRDGSNVLSSVAVTNADTFAFTGLNIDVPAGTTKTLAIYAKANHIATGYVVKGDGVAAVVTAVTATTNGFATVASITPTVTGNTQYLFKYAPTLALGTTSATPVDESVTATVNNGASVSLAFNVTAPTGSDIYVNATDGLLCGGTYPVTKIGNAACNSTTIGGTMTTAVSVSGTTSKGTGTLATWDKVAAGTTRTFTVTGYIPAGNAAGFTGLTMATNGLQWADTDNVTIVGTATTEQTWALSDFKTATVHVTAN